MKSKITCLNVDCPERSGGKCTFNLEDPNGIDVDNNFEEADIDVSTKRNNPECLHCGLLKSTIDSCETSCTLQRQHDFGITKEVLKPTNSVVDWEEDFYIFLSALQVEKFSPEVQRKFREFIHSTMDKEKQKERRGIGYETNTTTFFTK